MSLPDRGAPGQSFGSGPLVSLCSRENCPSPGSFLTAKGRARLLGQGVPAGSSEVSGQRVASPCWG